MENQSMSPEPPPSKSQSPESNLSEANSSQAKLPDEFPKIKSSYSRNYQGPWPKTPSRLLGVGLIRLYQLTLSGFIGNSCRHLPTCSEYTYEAIARLGFIRGVWLGSLRVLRCNPWSKLGGTHGHDPVPDK